MEKSLTIAVDLLESFFNQPVTKEQFGILEMEAFIIDPKTSFTPLINHLGRSLNKYELGQLMGVLKEELHHAGRLAICASYHLGHEIYHILKGDYKDRA